MKEVAKKGIGARTFMGILVNVLHRSYRACGPGLTLACIASRTLHSSLPTASTVGVEGANVYNVGNATNIKWHEGGVPRVDREARLGQRGCVLWFTGLSGSGKSTVAYTLEHKLHGLGKLAYVLDGDNLRHGLNADLGFSAEHRVENIRRVGHLSKLFANAGFITLVSFISPYRADRESARALCAPGEFHEVYMKVPVDVCEGRDPKGLYKKARAGQLKGFTGIDAPYEEPENAEVILEACGAALGRVDPTPGDMAEHIIEYLRGTGMLGKE